MAKLVGIIGGGISGLCVAYHLRKAGVDAALFESSASVGGNIKTEVRDGFLFEHGPNSTQVSRELLDLIAELGLSGEIAPPNSNSKKRFIVRNGKLVALPSGPIGLVGSPVLSRGAKLRLLREPFIRTKAAEDESVAAFFERRLGREIVDYAVDPFISGIYAGDPQKLGIRHAFPRLYELEKDFGSIIQGAIFGSKKASKLPKETPKSLTFRNGMQTLSDALAKNLGGRIKLNSSVHDLRKTESGKMAVKTLGGVDIFDSVVICTPAHAAARLIENLDAQTSAELADIYYPPIAVVFTAFKSEDVQTEPAGFGFLVPGIERRKILGSLWTSSVFENRAPAGYHLFTTFIGGSRNPEFCSEPEGRLLEIALEELDSILGINGNPVFTFVRRWEKAIPQYNIGYESVISALEDFTSNHPKIYFCSNFYNGIAVGDCVKNALATATEILDSLRS